MSDAPALDLATLRRRSSLCLDYPESFTAAGGAALWLERIGEARRLALACPTGDPLLPRFRGSERPLLPGYSLKLCPTDTVNALALRETLPWLLPRPLGLATSAGLGDRLGLATPGHARALRQIRRNAAGADIAPIFAQQSIREMARTDRTPDDVLRDATWGAFEAGWRGPLGADADHLKSAADIDATVAAGYTFFTLDPSAYVDGAATTAAASDLGERLQRLPWQELECTFEDTRRRYEDRPIPLERRSITIGGVELARAVAKYGGAVAHISRLFRHLAGKNIDCEVELSVDETETATSLPEHVYLAGELRRLGVQWVSLAPRYVGRFEKGVDYIGDLAALRSDLAGHAEIARALGPYKLSLHSGSDKFSVYPLIQEATGGLVHLKTAGTSYLEALRVAARLDPALFREILELAQSRYERDRASYHVSAGLGDVPAADAVPDAELEHLLDAFDARQVLHVTFGSVLAVYGPPLRRMIQTHEQAYSDALVEHFVPHLSPFVTPAVAAGS